MLDNKKIEFQIKTKFSLIMKIKNKDLIYKFEKINTINKFLPYEFQLYEKFKKLLKNQYENIFLKVYGINNRKLFNYMVMDYGGKDLEYLLKIKNTFNLKTSVILVINIIKKLKIIHEIGYLIKNLSPKNILIKTNDNYKTYKLYIIDLKISSYIGNQKKEKYDINFSSNVRFCSINSMVGQGFTKRDDLICITNILIYFIKGILPWMNLKIRYKYMIEKYSKIIKYKKDFVENFEEFNLDKNIKNFIMEIYKLDNLNNNIDYDKILLHLYKLLEKNIWIINEKLDL